MKMYFALSLAALLGIGAVKKIATLPPYDPVADVGKVGAISSTGTLSWATASGVSGAVVGPTGAADGDVAVFNGITGKIIKKLTASADGQVLRRASSAIGFGQVALNDGTNAVTGVLAIANGGTNGATAASGFANLEPATTKGDLIAYSTAPIRFAVGATGKMLTADSTQATGLNWTVDHIGSATNDSAAAGYVGELLGPISRVRSNALALTSGVVVNVGTTTSITLTPGDWQVQGYTCLKLTGSTTSTTNISIAISKTSATLSAADTLGVPTAGEVRLDYDTPAGVVGVANADQCYSIAPYRTSVASNTALFLVASSTFTVSTSAVFGSLEARRMR